MEAIDQQRELCLNSINTKEKYALCSVQRWFRGHEENLSDIQRKKDASVLQESKIKDLDIEKQLNSIEGLSDGNDFVKLSSNCRSLTMLGSDDSQDHYWNLALPRHFSSMLSLSGNCDVFFDGSRTSLIDEASLVLDRSLEKNYEGSSTEEVALWLHNAVKDEVKNSSSACSESGDSSYDRSFCEDSSSFESSCTSFCTQEETPLVVRNIDTTGIWVSSLDLDVEDSELICDKEQGFDVFDSDLPSPSFSARQEHQSAPSRTSSVTSFGQLEEFESLPEACDSDEPLFWPFDKKSYWVPDFEKNFLCMSPRKSGTNFGVQRLNSLKAVRLRLQKNTPHSGRKSMQEECRRRIVSGPLPNSSSIKHTESSANKIIQNISTAPSRLSRSSQASNKTRPLKISIPRDSLLDLKCQRRICDEQFLDMSLQEQDAKMFQDHKEVSIEKMVGLNEFDGHEGLNLEPQEDACT